MLTNILGYPRIGANRELKKACEKYWAGKISENELYETGKAERQKNWTVQMNNGIDLIPCNDFSFYDHVQDLTFMLNAIPGRYCGLKGKLNPLDLYFAMCRGYQDKGYDITAMEMTKWFDTNYHYIVPEFTKSQKFEFLHEKIIDEFIEAKAFGVKNPKPVLIGPVSYLLLGKEKEPGFNKMDLIDNLLPAYLEILKKLKAAGCEYIQIDEPYLVTCLPDEIIHTYKYIYQEINKNIPGLNIILTTYFDDLGTNLDFVLNLPVYALHVDLVRNTNQFNELLQKFPKNMNLSIGLIDGRNIWKNNLQQSLNIIQKAKKKINENRLILSSSCSFLHVPYDLEPEKNLPDDVKSWMAFAKQKVEELACLKELSTDKPSINITAKLLLNDQDIISRRTSKKTNNPVIKQKVEGLGNQQFYRTALFKVRKIIQDNKLNLPLFPTTTIGSFPQTVEVRKKRQEYKNSVITESEYEDFIKAEIKKTIEWQEKTGLDVLVHGEFERNDMVEYFGEQLEGFVFTTNGWVQSYGSRGVKPPVIFGDVWRKKPMTVDWTKYAQSLTGKQVKGMLTGPVTILQWSFVRDDQLREITAYQIALAIKDEVEDLERTGIDIIQIDEPAIREGLPLKQDAWKKYLAWTARAFRICCSSVKNETQIHTHMCYSEFNDIFDAIASMDADVLTVETSRSQMEIMEAFAKDGYPNQIGPGVYDIHSPRIPDIEEMELLIEKALQYIPKERLWINPDCGLKTRGWPEVKAALENMVNAAHCLRKKITVSIE